jgi:hypothetical protein
MATAPQAANLPLLYKDLIPLNSNDHVTWKSRLLENAKFLEGQHAIPLTIEEFVPASRTYPIIFSATDNPVPLVLMGMNEGVNTFMNEEGFFERPVYVPAYVRRYPFLLAKLRPDTEELSLCFDPTSGAVGEFEESKLRELRGDTVRKLNQNGILALIHAHLFSLQLMREIFAVQVAQGKVPQVTELPSA